MFDRSHPTSSMKMEQFLDAIPDSGDDLKDPVVKLDCGGGTMHHAKFNSNTMELLVKSTNDGGEGKLTLTIAVFHGMVQGLIKHTGQGRASINLINYASALCEFVETSMDVADLTPRKLLWMFLLNLKDNRNYVVGDNPPLFDGCNRGAAFAKFHF